MLSFSAKRLVSLAAAASGECDAKTGWERASEIMTILVIIIIFINGMDSGYALRLDFYFAS